MKQQLSLIIEDNDGISSLYKEALEIAGFATHIVRDGQQAITELDQIKPDIIILDLNLPHVSGHYILRHIRANESFAKTPVIISTANTVIAEAMRDDLSHNDFMLIKPIDVRQLQQLALRLTGK
jgi:DNA-binding response OmpR family regulator